MTRSFWWQVLSAALLGVGGSMVWACDDPQEAPCAQASEPKCKVECCDVVCPGPAPANSCHIPAAPPCAPAPCCVPAGSCCVPASATGTAKECSCCPNCKCGTDCKCGTKGAKPCCPECKCAAKQAKAAKAARACGPCGVACCPQAVIPHARPPVPVGLYRAAQFNPIAVAIPLPHPCPVPPPPCVCAPLPPFPAAARVRGMVPCKAHVAIKVEAVKPACPACCVRVVTEDGVSKLEMQCCDSSMQCESMVVKTAGQTLKLAVADGRVQVQGPSFEATCDSIGRSPRKNQIVLAGHVKLRYHKDEEYARVSAGKVTIDLTDGQIVIKHADGVGKTVPVSVPVPCEESVPCPQPCDPVIPNKTGWLEEMEEILECVAEAVAGCCCGNTWEAPMTLPSDRYLEHPPQYFPPSPAFPLTRDLTPQSSPPSGN